MQGCVRATPVQAALWFTDHGSPQDRQHGLVAPTAQCWTVVFRLFGRGTVRVTGDGCLLLSLGFSSARHNCWIHLAELPPLGDPALCLESELHFEAQCFEPALYLNNWVCSYITTCGDSRHLCQLSIFVFFSEAPSNPVLQLDIIL